MKFFKLLLLFILSLLRINIINAEDNKYLVYDNRTKRSFEFNNYKDAKEFYDEEVDLYDNLIISFNDEVIEMEYGVICFNNDDLIEYYSLSKNDEDCLYGLYGIDAAYLYSKDDNVYFYLNNDLAYVEKKNVKLIPYEDLGVKPSYYYCDDKYLYHEIKSQLDYEYSNDLLRIDFKLAYLDINKSYFSYDGHYFYDDFYLMIDDYRNGLYEHSINRDDKYYNYYQYLSFHSLSNYSYQEVENYYYDELGINSRINNYIDYNNDGCHDVLNESELYGSIADFFVYQYEYGNNAMLLLSKALIDSEYGRSLECLNHNSLFKNNAYTSLLEAQNECFDSVSESIASYNKNILNKLYSNVNKDYYSGTFLGNKSCGINVNDSIDSYYGEKIASIYFELDEKLGLKDYQKYTIAVIEDKLKVYKDDDLKEKYCEINNINELCFVILNEYDDSYSIYFDNYGEEYKYDYSAEFYIDKDDIKYLVENKKEIDEFKVINYDFNGGLFNEEGSLSLKINKDNLVYPMCYKDGYKLIGYQYDEIKDLYLAQYKKIEKISLAYELKGENFYPYLNLNENFIYVYYEDNSIEEVKLNKDMISYVDVNCYDEQEITISYCGQEIQRKISIDKDEVLKYSEFNKAIEDNDYSYIKNNIDIDKSYLSFDLIRNIDNKFSELNKRNYVIEDNINCDLSVSGLDLSLDEKFSFNFINNTYYVIVDKIINQEEIEKVSYNYGYESVYGLNIGFEFNYQNVELKGPVIIESRVDNNDAYIYVVYHLDENNNLIKCETKWSNNYVLFKIYEGGDYLILRKKTNNKYNFADELESLNKDNMGYDNHGFNIRVLCFVILYLLVFIEFISYYIFKDKKDKAWKDFKKLLQRADIVQEEKLKN